MSSNQLGPCPPHPMLLGPNHPTPPAILAFSQVPGHSRKLSPQGLCICCCHELGREKPYLMPSHPSGLNLRIISFKTSSWAKSFVVVKYIQPKIDHFSHFQEYASGVCSAFTLYNHHATHLGDFLLLPNRNSVLLNSDSHSPSLHLW